LADCTYCGKRAGFFRRKHAECEEKYALGKQQILHSVSRAVLSWEPPNELNEQITSLARNSYISDLERGELLVRGWANAVDLCLEDGVLHELEEEGLLELKSSLSLPTAELERTGAVDRLNKAAVIRDLLNGVIPSRYRSGAVLPINLQKGEKIVWAFPEADYLEDRTRRQYVGGSQGVSLRVMKGVYYRIGAFKGEGIDRVERTHIDTGWVVITDRHIYFAGPSRSLRVTYSKIVSFQPFSDGIGIIRDAVSAKPQLFITGDGWFTYNLVTNLAQL